MTLCRTGRRIRSIAILAFLAACVSFASGSDAPPADAFRILPPPGKEAPVITPYLRYQVDMAWKQDEQRVRTWQGIRTEEDLLSVQRTIEEHLLSMLGGLPKERTPLHPRITGTIQMDGFRIEKLVFQSLPGIYVSALLYVPEDGNKSHPAILVPAGHAANGKVHYQALCQRLVQRGYVVISWDPVGQGERSQFWDAKAGKSRYNLICAEHAILGNLAYLAGTNLARWQIWDGIRAVDYLLTRPDVDPQRINITGTSGGGFQAAHIAALDGRIKVAAPSCYITALPMRMYNRIFQDPDSDPEQDLYGMISSQVDNAGLLLMMYPRPVFVSAGVLDFFPIEGAHKAVREVSELYSMFHHADRIGMAEGYHAHEYSLENQEAALDFLDHFNGLPAKHGFAPVKELDEKALQCTKTGQVMLDFEDARSLMDLIREYYVEHKSSLAPTLQQLYNSSLHPRIDSWSVSEFRKEIPGTKEILWEAQGSSQFEGITIEKYLLHHSRYLEMPLLYIHKADGGQHPVLLWLGENEKATAKDWPSLMKYINAGYDVVSFDPRGLGETRMPYKAASPDDPSLGRLDFVEAYISPISGVLAGYVYNSILTGRAYFLQMIEDAEIATLFVRSRVGSRAQITVVGTNSGYSLARAISETLPGVKLLPSADHIIEWSELVSQKAELWPIQYLLPGGAYIH
jgi:Acetyl xylan esterase (AXE1)